MITVTSLRFSDKKSNFIVHEEFYSLVFENEEFADTFIESRKIYWEGVLLMKLTMSPNYNETLKIIEIKKVFRFVARKLGFTLEAMLGKTRKQEIVDARKYAMMICINRHMPHQMIAEQIGLDRTTIIHHEKSLSNLMETDKEVYDTYYELEDYVLISLNGEYEANGSGTKLK